MPENTSVENLQTVRENIAKALTQADRPKSSVTLIAVTKKFDADDIRPVLDDGHRTFGENRVQEAAGKWPELRAAFDGIKLHLIGPLQTNKVKDAVALFEVIETVDRPKLAKAIATEMTKTDKRPCLMVQVNTGAETQKAGIAPSETKAFVQQCRDEFGLTISGLMCIPPANENPAPHFALLTKLARECDVSLLSMGMSADYEMAAQLGATHVRVGSGVFGQRPSI